MKNNNIQLKKCICSSCVQSPQGFQLVTYNTRMNHMNNDKVVMNNSDSFEEGTCNNLHSLRNLS